MQRKKRLSKISHQFWNESAKQNDNIIESLRKIAILVYKLSMTEYI